MNFTSDDLRKYDIINFINELPFKTCDNLSEEFLNKYRDLNDDNQDSLTKKNIYTFLGNLCSLCLVPNSKAEPFQPFLISGNSRSAIIDDFHDEEVLAFFPLLERINNPDLRARFADVLWLRMKDYQYAQLAVNPYLECVQKLIKGKKYTYCEKRIERVINLAVSLGKNNKSYKKVRLYIKKLILDYQSIYEKEQYFIYTLIRLLNEKGISLNSSYAEILFQLSEQADIISDFEHSRLYLLLSSQIYSDNQENEKQKEMLTKNAESYVKQAELSVSKMVASNYLMQAIEAYRRIGNFQNKIEELHKTLLIVEKESLQEMGQITTPIDLREEAKHAIEQVSNKSLEDAIFQLALLIVPSNLNDLEDEFKQEMKTSPLKVIVSAQKVNREGKVVGKKPSLLSKDPEEAEEAKLSELFSNAQFGYFIYTNGFIEPARKQIMKEHILRLSDLGFIVNNNPFIPEGREYIYAKGLYSGFEGDYFTSIHILIPQIENSIRYILTRSGIITSTISSDGLQDEKTLKSMLLHEKTKEIFGEDIIFDLRCILIERYGANIRNELAHGLLDYVSFYRPEIIFLWGLILRICCWPILFHKNKTQENSK